MRSARAGTAAADGMRLAVVIVNYRAAGLILDGLPALMDELANFREGVVLIVDNASPGDDANRLEAALTAASLAPAVQLIRSPRNGGFAAGNNIAFAVLDTLGWRPDAVMLLNPDAAVKPGTLLRLAKTMLAHPEAGVVGATLENEDGSRAGSAFRFPSAMGEFAQATGLGILLRIWPVLVESPSDPVPADWVTGAAMMIRMPVLERLGGMDEGFFLYYEEVDFMRAVQRAGWQVWTVPDARVVHRAGASTGVVNSKATTGAMPAYWFASWRRYFEKNHGTAYARAAAIAKLAGMALGAVKAGLRGQRRTLPQNYIRDFLRYCLLGMSVSGSQGHST